VAGFYVLVSGRENIHDPEMSSDCLSFEYRGDSCENVLVNLLTELIFLLYTRNRVVPTLKIRGAGRTFLKAGLVSYLLDQDPRVEIKSVTYHNLKVKQDGAFKSVSVVFDI
jgi:SHS2 domain-containing protein